LVLRGLNKYSKYLPNSISSIILRNADVGKQLPNVDNTVSGESFTSKIEKLKKERINLAEKLKPELMELMKKRHELYNKIHNIVEPVSVDDVVFEELDKNYDGKEYGNGNKQGGRKRKSRRRRSNTKRRQPRRNKKRYSRRH